MNKNTPSKVQSFVFYNEFADELFTRLEMVILARKTEQIKIPSMSFLDTLGCNVHFALSFCTKFLLTG